MPILFFDVDGPMVPGRALFMPKNIVPRYGWQFDPCAVGMLNFLDWAVPNLRVVISSHRVGMTSPFDGTSTDSKESWERIFFENGLFLKIHDDWCTVHGQARYAQRTSKLTEIRQWLARHKEHLTDNFVVIEDEAEYYREITDEERETFHICAESYLEGITWKDLDRISTFLGVENLGDKLKEYQQKMAKIRTPIVKRRITRTLEKATPQAA
jgi:hypothetical protein